MSDSSSGQARVLAFPWVQQETDSEDDLVEFSNRTTSAWNDDDYRQAVEHVTERLHSGKSLAARDRSLAPVLYAELLACPPQVRLQLARGDERFGSYLLAEMLLEKCRECWFDDSRQAVDMATLGLTVAHHLDAGGYDRRLRFGLLARGWAYLANSRRVGSDLPGAEQAMEEARKLLDSATPAEERLDPYLRAEVLSLRVSLLCDLARYAEADVLLDTMSDIYDAAADQHQLGRARIQQGVVRHLAWRAVDGDPDDLDTVVDLLYQGLGQIDTWREGSLVVCARQNLSLCFMAQGRDTDAQRELAAAIEVCERLGDRLNLLRLRWAGADLDAAADRLDEAEEEYLHLQARYLELDMSYEAARVSLDLAMVYTRRGEVARIQQLAQEMLPIFQRQQLGREVMAALILFVNAAEKQLVTLGLLREIAAYLERAQQRSSTQPI